jgi:hypothetical protein
MPIKVKKSSKKKSGKKSQSQQQTVIVNIDKKRRARNPTQDLLKAQALKLQQLQSISQMRTPELNNLNIQLEELKKEKEKKQSQEKAQVNNDLLEIKRKLETLQESANKLQQKPKEKEFIQEEEEEPPKEEPPKEETPTRNIVIPPNRRVNIKPIFLEPPKKKEEEQPAPAPKTKPRNPSVTQKRMNEFITNLSIIPEELISDIQIFRGSQPRITPKLKQYYLENTKAPVQAPRISLEEFRKRKLKNKV